MHSRVYISGRRGSPGGSPGGVPLNGVLQTSSKNLKGGCWMHFCVSFLHSMDDIQLRCATQVALCPLQAWGWGLKIIGALSRSPKSLLNSALKRNQGPFWTTQAGDPLEWFLRLVEWKKSLDSFSRCCFKGLSNTWIKLQLFSALTFQPTIDVFVAKGGD